jgi:branched-chain amino acid transport system substrate-binding protein
MVAPATARAALTIYSSLPLQGVQDPQSLGIVAGARRALADAGATAGGMAVRYVSLDDSTARAGTWAPAAVARNAREAATDGTTIAYLGEFNSGASAISIPILNEAGVMQISPSNTAIGLTLGGPGSERGTPAKYYPTGRRTYGRVAPNDAVQARAGARLLELLGKRNVLVVNDGELYGLGLARLVSAALKRHGVHVVGFRRLGRHNAGAIARAARRADAVYFGGITSNGAPALWRALASRPALVKVGSDGVAESAFYDPSYGGIPARAARKTYITLGTLAPSAYPAAGRSVLRALKTTNPYALYGYEAMALALDSIDRGGPTRAGALGGLFATRDRDSVIGRYSIDANGDTTTTRFGVYRIVGGDLRFDRVVDAGT